MAEDDNTIDESFDDRIARVVESKLGIYVSENMDKYFQKVVDAVKAEVDTKGIAKAAAEQATAMLKAEGETFRQELVAKATESRQAAPEPEPEAQAEAPVAEAKNERGRRVTENLLESMAGDPGRYFELAFAAFDRWDSRHRSDDLSLLKTLAERSPELFQLYTPSALGPETLSMVTDAVKLGMRAKTEAATPDPLGRSLEGYDDRDAETAPIDGERANGTGEIAPTPGVETEVSERDSEPLLNLASLVP